MDLNFSITLRLLEAVHTLPIQNQTTFGIGTLNFKVSGINELFQKLKEQGYSVLSENIVEIGFSGQDENLGFIGRDPDGHALLFIGE